MSGHIMYIDALQLTYANYKHLSSGYVEYCMAIINTICMQSEIVQVVCMHVYVQKFDRNVQARVLHENIRRCYKHERAC